MAKRLEKIKSLALRKSGNSYKQISEKLGVSKGTLSIWLRDIPLSNQRMRELRDWSQLRIEKYRATRKEKREKLFSEIYKRQEKKILPFTDREIFICGLFLYWGEGSKNRTAEIRLTNSDPSVIRAFLAWLRTLRIEQAKIKIRLHLYKDMDILTETRFWTRALGISSKQFVRPYIKNSKLSGLTYKHGFNHGTCNVIVADAMLSKNIMMGLKVLQDYFARVAQR